jgi:hypothetical protein
MSKPLLSPNESRGSLTDWAGNMEIIHIARFSYLLLTIRIHFSLHLLQENVQGVRDLLLQKIFGFQLGNQGFHASMSLLIQIGKVCPEITGQGKCVEYSANEKSPALSSRG